MSDDGFVEDAWSPYSDFEDLLYDADPSPDLAEDLASHAVHSPVFADEPGYELLEHHSDWEYYSDDYYDDDPNILQHNPQDGNLSKRPAPMKRGKKRKLADIGDIPQLDLGERVKLRDCIRGTVWAQPAATRDNTFNIGTGKKVALLQDWKKHFQPTPKERSSESSGRVSDRDESWANNMSLADMGLLTERSSRLEQPGETNGDGADDEDEAQENVEGDDEYDEAEEALGEAARVLLEDAEPATLEEGAEFVETAEAELDLDMLPSRPLKRSRRTKDLLPSPPTSTESTAIDGEPPTLNDPAPQIQKPGRGRPLNVQRSAANDDPEGELLDQPNSSTTTQQKSKKRKASASPPPSQDPTGPRILAKPRNKRIASTAMKESIESNLESTHNPAPSTRSTRKKK